MSKLKETHQLVLEILKKDPATRSDDYLLIYQVLQRYNVSSCNIDYVLTNHAALGLPSLETITRCRRKIQADHPELYEKGTRKKRQELQAEYKQYALNIE